MGNRRGTRATKAADGALAETLSAKIIKQFSWVTAARWRSHSLSAGDSFVDLGQPILYLILLSVSSSGGCAYLRDREVRQEQSFPAKNIPVEQVVQTSAAINLNFIANAVERVGPAVVRIDAVRGDGASGSNNNGTPQSFGNSLAGEFSGAQLSPPEARRQRGTGSGFIISQDGRLLTNAHVVAEADQVTVLLKDGRSFEGQVIGTDPVTDIAAVKIDATGLPSVKMGNSETLVPGQWAIAIGNPLGLDNTVTAGIISAIERSSSDVGAPDKRISFIQTDAAINPGNSGGPLLNERGEVIGVNTAIINQAQGLGFAIPVELAERVVNQLFAKGRVEHPYLGVQMIDLTPTVREEINQSGVGFEVRQDQGVLIVQVIPKSPAVRAGLRAGDLIEKVNGTPIQSTDQLKEQVEAMTLGDTLELEVNRDDRAQRLTIKPEPLPPVEIPS